MRNTTLTIRRNRTGLLAAFALSMLVANGGASADTFTQGVDGPANVASLGPLVWGLALAPSGEVMISDESNGLIRKLSANYQLVSTLAGTLGSGTSGPNHADGKGPAAKFSNVMGLAVDAAGNTYVADSGNHVVRKITPAGDVTTLAGQPGVCGIQDGRGQGATLCNPSSIAVDGAGTVYVSHRTPSATPNGPALSSRIRKIAADGAVSTLASEPSKYSVRLYNYLPDRSFFDVLLAVDSTGTLHAADPNDHVVRKYAADGQASVVSGTESPEGGEVDGPANVARFQELKAITFDRQGRLFVLDTVRYSYGFLRNSIRRIDADGSVTTLVRSPTDCGSSFYPNPPPMGSLCNVRTMAAGADGHFLVAESTYEPLDVRRSHLRRYSPQGTSTALIGPGTGAPGVAAVARMDGPLADTRLQIDVSGMPASTGGPGQQQHLWLGVLHNSQLRFVGEHTGLVTFQCPGTCDAPANRDVTGSPQRIEYQGWDVRGLIGAKIYLGWGRSFGEMVESGQILEIHTVAPAP